MDDHNVDVIFKEVKIGGARVFRVFCAIAVVQDFYTGRNQNTQWSGMGGQLWRAIANAFQWKLEHISLSKYWSNIRNAGKTYVQVVVDGQELDDQYRVTQVLFGVERGAQFFGQREQLEENKYKLSTVRFTETDKDFEELHEAVTKIAATVPIPAPPETGKQYVEVVHGVSGTPYDLDGLRGRANESIFLAGQNLYRLVEDEVEALKKGAEIEGHHRGELRNWLKEGRKRSGEMLMCDPTSEAAVLHYAIVFGMNFIKHLCQAIPRYQLWQNEMSGMGLDTRVTNVVPLSLVAMDAKSADLDRGLMTLTPMAFEPRSGVRSTFIIRRNVNQAIFEDLYGAFHQRFLSECTRSVLKVSKDELAKCMSLIERLH